MTTRSRPVSIEMINISKTFPGVYALDGVDFSVRGGEVHALVGENGAGKSTLMKVLAGVYKMDEGEIRINGERAEINNPFEAKKYGIGMIYQEFSLIPELSIAQNVFFGMEKTHAGGFFLNKRQMNEFARQLLMQLNLAVDPRRKILELTVGEQQIVEVAKALATDAKIVVMDEPTSALSKDEKENLFAIIRKLKERGISIIYITHRMKEIFEIADSVTIMRDGKKVGDYPVANVSEGDVVRLMVGRALGSIYQRERTGRKGDVVLKVQGLTKANVFKNISFEVREGEVLGIAGLMGAGRTEIVRAIFGLDSLDSGTILYHDALVRFSHPRKAIKYKIGYVPEDRKRLGFIPLFGVTRNISLPYLPWISHLGWVNQKKQLAIAVKYSEMLAIKMSSLDQRVMDLSGGNQQKVVLGKWLASNAKLLILDEPTRGIDVGAKSEIHGLISDLVRHNMAIIMISSELPEILGISDRIIVIHEGELTAELDHTEANEERIMLAATGTRQ